MFYIHLKTFSSNLGGSISIHDWIDLQQHAVIVIIYTVTDYFSVRKHTQRLSSR